MKENNFDAIVIGAGMSGGWAAKEFCENGFKTLLLERGRNVEHLIDYHTTNMRPWEFKYRGRLTAKEKKESIAVKANKGFSEDNLEKSAIVLNLDLLLIESKERAQDQIVILAII